MRDAVRGVEQRGERLHPQERRDALKAGRQPQRAAAALTQHQPVQVLGDGSKGDESCKIS